MDPRVFPMVVTLVMSNAAGLPPGRAAAAVTVPMTITTHCTDDVTGAFNSWLRSGPDGSALAFGAGGCDCPQLAAEQSRSPRRAHRTSEKSFAASA